MRKKIITFPVLTLIIFSVLLPLLLPVQSINGTTTYGWNPDTGIMPKCVESETTACGICDVFELILNIISFLLFTIIPPLAILMFVIGGAAFIFSAGNPAMLSNGKRIMTSVIIGIVIAYGSYLIVGEILRALGLANFAVGLYHSWFGGAFQITCH